MTKLNQIIAIEKNVKSQALADLTAAYQKLQKGSLLAGISRVYSPKDEDGEVLPPEFTKVQVVVADTLRQTAKVWAEMYNVVGTKDDANQQAVSDVVVDGKTILSAVPVTFLLFLEKELVGLHTLVKSLPILDPSEDWTWDEKQGVYVNQPTTTTRSKKVPKVLEKAPATDKHPAQVDVYTEDVTIGTWKTIKFSGAMPATDVAKLVARVEKLQRAVKFARESANSLDVGPTATYGDGIAAYLFE